MELLGYRRLFLIGLLVGGPVSAQILQPTSQSRTVACSAGVSDGSRCERVDFRSRNAPDFGAFVAEISAGVSGCGASATSYATQTSELGPSSIDITGGVHAAFAPSYFGYAGSSAGCHASIRFGIGTEASYVYRLSMQATLLGYAGTTSFHGTLVHPSGVEDSLIVLASSGGPACCTQSRGVQRSGALEPGEYRLAVNLDAGGSMFSTAGYFTIHFEALDILPVAPATWSRVKALYRGP